LRTLIFAISRGVCFLQNTASYAETPALDFPLI
jgi:hypothetical protein